MSDLQKEFDECYELYKQSMIDSGCGLTFIKWFKSQPEGKWGLVSEHVEEIESRERELSRLYKRISRTESIINELKEQLPKYTPTKPYSPKYVEEENGWFIADSEGIPFQGLWGTHDKINPPRSLISWIATLNSDNEG